MNARVLMMTEHRREIFLVTLLLAAGLWLRVWALDQYPLGVHQDELSNIYDGYSIRETGADRFGDRYRLQVWAFGGRVSQHLAVSVAAIGSRAVSSGANDAARAGRWAVREPLPVNAAHRAPDRARFHPG